MHVDTLGESRSVKTIDLYRRRAKAQPRVLSARNGEVYDPGNLRRDAVESER
jgi:hypothetical protein